MGVQEKEVNELKRVFLEGNPYFLMLTFLVSMLHSVFDALAFKNDIGFWKANTSMVRSPHCMTAVLQKSARARSVLLGC